MSGINNEAIGTLAEGMVHKSLKELYEPRPEYREVVYLGFVADIKNENGITEIQTRSYNKLLPKLRLFLENDNVTVVTPVVTDKLVFTLDEESGELLGPRKSPKHERAEHLCRELNTIREYIPSPRLTVKLLYISATETRLMKKTRRGRIIKRELCEIRGETVLKTPEDYAAIFLPEGLDSVFYANDYAKAIKLPKSSFTASCLVFIILTETSGCSTHFLIRRLPIAVRVLSSTQRRVPFFSPVREFTQSSRLRIAVISSFIYSFSV